MSIDAGPNDGTLSVEETKSAYMTDFVTVHAPHTSIMYNDSVGEHVVSFLRTGKFN